MTLRQTVGASIGTVVVVVIGLIIVCAGPKPKPVGDDRAAHRNPGPNLEEEYQRDVMNLMEFRNTGGGETLGISKEEMNEIMALLGVEAEPVPPKAPPKPKEPAVNPELFQALETEIARLEKELDSLKKEWQNLNTVNQVLEDKLRNLQEQLSERKKLRRKISKTDGQVGPVRQAQPGARPPFEEEYEETLSLFNRRQYARAAERFEALLGSNPLHPLADNCQYWIGECNFALKKYPQAIVEFQKVFSYAATEKGDDAQLMVALAFLRMGDARTARREFQRLLTYYGHSEYTKKAQRYLAQLGP